MIKTKFNFPLYFFICWLFSIYLCQHFLGHVPNETLLDHIHHILVLATYALMYLLPAIITYIILKKWDNLSLIFAVLLSVSSHLFIFFDSHLYDLYGFHINGFVWNLVTTEGGIASLGADQTKISLVLSYILILGLVHAFAFFLAKKIHYMIPLTLIIALFFVSTLSERFIYGYSRAQLYAPVLQRGEAMPLYQPMKMKGALEWLGVEVKRSKKVKMAQTKGTLDYPKNPIKLNKVKKPFNIIMLISESLRFDLLTPEIMPNLYALTPDSWYFKHHYSGGNGTRQGLFSLFYGIQGNYWDLFLRNKKAPVFFDVLEQYHYQYYIYTSASFTYPELDQTIFSAIPKEKLIENNTQEPWKRDQKNTTLLLEEIKKRKKDTPYFGFIFYEGTHARYSFPENQVIRKNYLKTMDYAGLSREELAPQIAGMKARYENAAHAIDIQIKRVIEELKAHNELDNTLIIITGDHGEEFMERGRWGHNSAFTDWQIRVPLVVLMPKSQPMTTDKRTSHMDITPTILTRLGVQNPLKDYSLGQDLAKPKENRTIIVASWSDIGLINDNGKIVIPFKSTTQHQNLTTDLADNPIDSAPLIKKMQTNIMESITNARYYSK